MRKCEITEEKLFLYFYGELPSKESQVLETHLSTCKLCVEVLRSIHDDLDLLAHNEIEEPPPETWKKVFSRILVESAFEKVDFIHWIKVIVNLGERVAQLCRYVGLNLRASWRRSVRVPVPVAVVILLALLGFISLSLIDRFHPSKQLITQRIEPLTPVKIEPTNLNFSETTTRSTGFGQYIPFIIVPLGQNGTFYSITNEKDPIIFVPVPAINPYISRHEERQNKEIVPSSL